MLNAINVVDGQVRELYSGSEAVGQPAWLPDGRIPGSFRSAEGESHPIVADRLSRR